jgi:hypothetical protein
MYPDTYDDKHRTLRVERSRPRSPRVIQKGLRERLLCAKCETQISGYEAAAAPIVKALPLQPVHESGLFLLPQQVDYRMFKLFQMSLLWRAAVSQDPMFAGASLGRGEPRLRGMLAGGRPGRSHNYGCVLAMVPDTKYLHTIIGPPVRVLIQGFHCIRFQIGRVFWQFFISDLPAGHSIRRVFLSETGRLVVFLPRWSEQAIVQDIARALRMRSSAA